MAKSVNKIQEEEPQYNEKKALYSVDDVRYIVFGNNVGRSMISELIGRGEIPYKKFGTRVFIPAWWVKEQLEFGFNKAM